MLKRPGGRHGHLNHASTLHAGGLEGNDGYARGSRAGREPARREGGGTLIAYYLTSGDYDVLLIFQMRDLRCGVRAAATIVESSASKGPARKLPR
jgi:hypothetical protein